MFQNRPNRAGTHFSQNLLALLLFSLAPSILTSEPQADCGRFNFFSQATNAALTNDMSGVSIDLLNW
jgi:hypothetical protein